MYGYEKVIVVELKSEWDLAMRPGGEIIRIRKKQGLHTGDVIYILPEDIISQKNDNTLLFCAASQPAATQNQEAPKAKKHARQTRLLLRQLASVAAIFAICFSVLLFSQHLPVQVYAVASFDADQSLQIELDKDLRILSVHSVDASIPESMLTSLKGQQLQDVERELRCLVGDGPCLLGYAPQTGEADPWLERQLQELFSDRSVLLLTGTAQDIPAAKESDLSLGQYLAGHHLPNADKDVLDDLDDLDAAALEQMINLLISTPHWSEKEDFREAVEDLQEDLEERREEEAEKASEEAEDADAEDEDDDTEVDDNHPDDTNLVTSPDKPETPSSADVPDVAEQEGKDEDDDAEHDTDNSDCASQSSDDSEDDD